VVLEPLPGSNVRYGGDDLSPAARGDRPHAEPKYTFAPEIFGHAQRIARHFGLYENALFSTEVTGLAWDDPSARWIVSDESG
jgi:hypothetical protein